MAVLEVSGPGVSRPLRHGVSQAFTTIGRGLANTLVLRDDASVSLRHASIRRQPDGYLLRDEGSCNGTWVNGERIEERLLRHGDRIRIGGTEIVFFG